MIKEILKRITWVSLITIPQLFIWPAFYMFIEYLSELAKEFETYMQMVINSAAYTLVFIGLCGGLLAMMLSFLAVYKILTEGTDCKKWSDI